MSDMSALDYAIMVEDTHVNTRIIEYRKREPGAGIGERKGELLAVALTDTMSDGLSMVYSFFNTRLAKRSLGTLLWRVGRSYGMGEGGRFVLTPHAVFAAEHDSAEAERSAVGAGVGLNARWWFHEDRHHAPARYLDFNVQYRKRIGGSERIDGVAAYLLLRF